MFLPVVVCDIYVDVQSTLLEQQKLRNRMHWILSTQAMRQLEEKNPTTPVIQTKFLRRPMSLVKMPWLADDWSESEVENKSEREDHDDVGDESDGAEKSIPEMKIAEIDSLVSEGCVCCNEN